jgi:hypothetical protein
MILLGIVLYITLSCFLIRADHKKEGYFSTITVFSMTAFLYYIAIPAEIAITGGADVYIGGIQAIELTRSSAVVAVWMGVLALAGFSTGYRASGFFPLKWLQDYARLTNFPPPSAKLLVAPVSVLSCYAIILLLFYHSHLLIVATYSGNVSTMYKEPLFAFILSTTAMYVSSIAAFWSLLVQPRLDRVFILCAALGIWGLYSSNKDPILLSLIAAGTYFAKPRRTKAWLLVFIVAAGLLTAAALPAFSLYRAGIPLQEIRHHYYFSFTRIDPKGPYIAFEEAINQRNRLQFGSTYVQALLMMIPRRIWPNRPQGIAEHFAQEMIYDWSEGLGLGYSLLAEAYINFGWAGAFVQYLFIGFLWGKTWNFIFRRMGRIEIRYITACYYTAGYYILTIMHRAAFVGIFKRLVHFFVPLIIASYVINNVLKGRGNRMALFHAFGKRRVK